MSRTEWESGDISIPRGEWAGFKTAIRDAYNAEQERLHAQALRFHEAVIKASAGERNVNWRALSERVMTQIGLAGHDSFDILWKIFSPNTQKAAAASGRGFGDPLDLRGSAGRPPKPTKSLYPLANGKTLVLHMPEASISFDEASRTVHWTVHENNHAVERARAHPVAAAFFRALGTVKWDTKCGGEIVGNDEYNQEDRGSGGGANYVVERFGRAKTAWGKSQGIKPGGPGGRSDGRRYVVNNFYRY